MGNAYADEILNAAGLHPYKKKTALSDEEIARLHEAVFRVPREAFELLRNKIGENIHKKERRYLNVHGKGGKPCPVCGYEISAITAKQRVTNFCRKCQPGLLVGN